MFGYVAHAFNYLAGLGSGISDRNLAKVDVGGNGSVECNSIEENADASWDRTDHFDPGKNGMCIAADTRLRKSFDGIITGFFNNRGLIDDHVYFTISSIIGNEKPRVGDSVHVEATRNHSFGGWIAKQVTVINAWRFDDVDSEDSKPYQDKLVASVVDFCNESVSLKADTEFKVNLQKFQVGYIPYRGDWVQIHILVGANQANPVGNGTLLAEEQIISIHPLREKCIKGVVTQLLRGYGFIDDDIFFTFSVCAKGKRLQVGERVFACIIESQQKKGEWRATYVSLLQSMSNQGKNLKDVAFNHSLPSVDDVCIPVDLNFGDINLGTSKNLDTQIQNNGKALQTFLSSSVSAISGLSFSVRQGSGMAEECREETQKGDRRSPMQWLIKPNESLLVVATFKPSSLGKVTIPVTFKFKGFEITRQLQARVIDSLQQRMIPASPFLQPDQRASTFLGQKLRTGISKSWVVPGQRPVRSNKNFFHNKLARYPIPDNLRDCIYNGLDVETVAAELAQPLHIANYKAKLTSLLHLEEIHQELEMEEFDMQSVVLRQRGEYLSLQVPGLGEGRPSLLLGDRVIVYYHGQPDTAPSYEGFIHEVHAADVSLKFSDDFHNSYRHEDLDVEFYFNRTPVRRCHQAVEHALNLGEHVLFPTAVQWKPALVDMNRITDEKGVLRPFNKILNERQLIAVTRIVAGHGRPIPYVLFGPPGTGKTVTLVEAILQVFHCIRYSRILACAPSNSAADLIAERLHESGLVKTSDMVRLNAYQRSSEVSSSIFSYCTSDTDDVARLSRRRIVVCTCSMAGFLYSLDLKTGHFTHVFVDEAGQATEPECMIPVGFSAGSEECQVVLAGDPYQLGPVLRSDVAKHYGLDMSYLERLTKRVLYERNEELFGEEGFYNQFAVTKLVYNYRSHASLLKLSSAVFYDDELVPCASSDLVNLFLGAEFLPNKQIPLIFHGVRGEDYQEGNSPSWFNPAEAVQVLKMVQLVTHVYRKALDPAEIGIISPYRKQVEKIRALLDQVDLSTIKVGSVEEFQGQERPVIVISTVRSREDKVNHDVEHNLGFLSNPKRFNVAITRAQALLIIVGNPHVLCHDVHWCALLQYAVANDCYYGCDLPSLHDEGVQESFRRALGLVGMLEKADHHDLNIYESDFHPVSDGTAHCDSGAEHSAGHVGASLHQGVAGITAPKELPFVQGENNVLRSASISSVALTGDEASASLSGFVPLRAPGAVASQSIPAERNASGGHSDYKEVQTADGRVAGDESAVRGCSDNVSVVPTSCADELAFSGLSVKRTASDTCASALDFDAHRVLAVGKDSMGVFGSGDRTECSNLDESSGRLQTNGEVSFNGVQHIDKTLTSGTSPLARTNALLASLNASAKSSKHKVAQLASSGVS